MSGKLASIEKVLRPLANEANAAQMKAYLRNRYDFLGIKTPDRRKAVKELFRQWKNEPFDVNYVEASWQMPQREFHSVAIDYIRARKDLTTTHIPWLGSLVTRNSWWDSVDALAKPIGEIATKEQMLKWSQEENIWLRRVSIIHQLGFKQKTNTELLQAIITQNLDTKEFFINKAIGWALRDYARTNPQWVINFVEKYSDVLAPLSIREALRSLPSHQSPLSQ
ncbi:DNA alkylation repair enzyme [Corynebacterium kutscheri]|uniref:DNA alkylation repair protein n=1 Tax=Corynebacterium kutscheri TaxID=35755 RepID=UPI000F6DB387|nr:DNA alkylation repair protein [Corynebacterium kutscheri]VEH81530.1 DNA alkylation repair enzyme [Corynebacterium kutscheri]